MEETGVSLLQAVGIAVIVILVVAGLAISSKASLGNKITDQQNRITSEFDGSAIGGTP